MTTIQTPTTEEIIAVANQRERWANCSIGINTAWHAIEEVLVKHYYNPDLEAAKAVYACVAAHRLGGAPVWPMVIGPPGSMKTELLEGLRTLDRIHFIDEMTPKTFISGQLEDPDKPSQGSPSLLHRIGEDGIIVVPDFSTVLGIKADHRASIFAQLRRIYDGQFKREFGTAERLEDREWKGRITCLVAVTPAVDKQTSLQDLGERFVRVRWGRAGGTEAALRAMNQDSKLARESLQQAVRSCFDGLGSSVNPTLPKTVQSSIAALTEFTVRARTYVVRNNYKEIVDVPEAESSTRLAQQLAQLVKGAALLSGREVADKEDLALARRVAFDSIPPVRRAILDCLIAGEDLKELRLSPATLSYALEELHAFRLVTNRRAGLAALTSEAQDLLGQAGIIM